jgi:hypothetical protein
MLSSIFIVGCARVFLVRLGMLGHVAHSQYDFETSERSPFFSSDSFVGFGVLSGSNPLVELHIWCSCTVRVVWNGIAGYVALLEGLMDYDC